MSPAPDKEKYPEKYKEHCRRLSKGQLKRFEDPKERSKCGSGGENRSKLSKLVWQTYREKMLKSINRIKHSESQTKAWKDDKKRQNLLTGVRSIVSREKKCKASKKWKYRGFKIDRLKEFKIRCILYGGRYCRRCRKDLLLDGGVCFHHIYLRGGKHRGVLDFSRLDEEGFEIKEEEMDQCLLLCFKCNSKIHWQSYNYLVKTLRIKEYISWFLRKYGVVTFSNHIKGKQIVKHHIDLNIKNNEKENLLFLSRSNHNPLHQKSYNYLIEIGEVENYISWFLESL